MRDRTIKINVFLNEDEKKIFDEKAKKSGLNKSEFFRKIILDYQLSEKPDERFYEFLHQLRGMATNLNQMAKIYNQNYGYVNMSKYKTMLDEIIEYYKKVTYDCEIKSIAEGEQIKIEFLNGSIINLITKENMISEICSQVIFMDSRIRETYIKEVIN